MNDHLPECPCIAVGVPSCICDNDEECGPQCRHHCICTALRACEQRSYTLGIEVGKHDGWLAGHAAGVQAARDAVAALGEGRSEKPFNPAYSVWSINDALAAIQRLIDGPDMTPSDGGK